MVERDRDSPRHKVMSQNKIEGRMKETGRRNLAKGCPCRQPRAHTRHAYQLVKRCQGIGPSRTMTLMLFIATKPSSILMIVANQFLSRRNTKYQLSKRNRKVKNQGERGGMRDD